MLKSRARYAVAIISLFAAVASAAQTPYVLLARRIIGRVEKMSQTSKDGESTFDTANVIIDVPVDKVFATLKSSLDRAQTTQGIVIVRRDDAAHVIEFARGDQKATIQVATLGDNLTHLMVSSVQPTAQRTLIAGKEAAPTPIIVERIMAVCREMNVECSTPP